MSLYAKSITFEIDLNQEINAKNIIVFLKQYLLKKRLPLNVNISINITYLCRAISLKVIEIEPYFYSPDVSHEEVSYICFINTNIKVVQPQQKSNKHKLCFKDFFGYSNQIRDLEICLRKNLDKDFTFEKKNGILIIGPSGVGKSFLLGIIQAEFGDKFIPVKYDDVKSIYIGETEERIKHVFTTAAAKSPCIVAIDEIDILCGNREEKADVNVITCFLHLLDGISEVNTKGVLLVGTCISADKLDAALRRPGRISTQFIFDTPSQQDRFKILNGLITKMTLTSLSESFRENQDQTLASIAAQTHGFTAADLRALLSEGIALAECCNLMEEHLFAALKTVKPSAMRVADANVPKIALSSIKGYNASKDTLLACIQMSLTQSDLFAACDLSCPRRFLLFGPPGCGKSQLVLGVANHFNLAVISVRRSNVFGKFFGQTEKNLAKLFEKASSLSPCILHIEHLDALAPLRAKADTANDVEGRLINLLKTLLDGVDNGAHKDVFVMAETNRPDIVDKDVIREGRFHSYIYIDLPSLQDRKALVESVADFDAEILQLLLKRTQGCTAAEVLQLSEELMSEFSKDVTLNAKLQDTIEAFPHNTSAKLVNKYKQFAQIYEHKS